MGRASLRALVGAVVVAALASACSGSSGGSAHSTPPPTTGGVDLVATPVTDVSTQQLETAATVLKKRFAILGIDASVDADLNPGQSSELHVTVSNADVAAAKFVITERGLIEFRQVLQTRATAAAKCQPNPNAFGATHLSGVAVVCDPADNQILLVGPVAVDQSNVTDAQVSTAAGVRGSLVNVMFDKAGSSAWSAITKKAFAATGSTQDGFGTCKPPRGCNAIAIVLDGGLIEVPSIPGAGGIAGGDVELSGNFQTAIANDLAATLKSGPLPVAFTVPS